MKQKLKDLFASNTEKDEIHYTSDGSCFWERQQALVHARQHTADGKVTSVLRLEYEETDTKVLAGIQRRKNAIRAIIDPYKVELQALSEKENAIRAKAATAATTK